MGLEEDEFEPAQEQAAAAAATEPEVESPAEEELSPAAKEIIGGLKAKIDELLREQKHRLSEGDFEPKQSDRQDMLIGTVVHFVEFVKLNADGEVLEPRHMPGKVVTVFPGRIVDLEVTNIDPEFDGAHFHVPRVRFDDSANPKPRTWHFADLVHPTKK